ncbi:uncharacterized protein LOC133161242 isoform X1 [Syngnathus typhle]|uniref:uncharacterized protein LOC133161242 isoform X1 n=1 Tax=Syngnathus typhle TaxID=161592 RepID=UPI002A6AAB6D|nr:uncharacterized protein LOC133161242 isoform X1 [Syngnathus typhle]
MTTKKQCVMAALENLTDDDFKKFCDALVNRPGEKKVAKSKVQDQPRLDVTNVMVSTFTEDETPTVVIELLESINLCDEAKKFGEEIAKIPKPSPPKATAATATTAATAATAATPATSATACSSDARIAEPLPKPSPPKAHSPMKEHVALLGSEPTPRPDVEVVHRSPLLHQKIQGQAGGGALEGLGHRASLETHDRNWEAHSPMNMHGALLGWEHTSPLDVEFGHLGSRLHQRMQGLASGGALEGLGHRASLETHVRNFQAHASMNMHGDLLGWEHTPRLDVDAGHLGARLHQRMQGLAGGGALDLSKEMKKMSLFQDATHDLPRQLGTTNHHMMVRHFENNGGVERWSKKEVVMRNGKIVKYDVKSNKP